MILVLDFDRVVFDTDKFIADLATFDLDKMDRSADLLEAIAATSIDWTSYVYDEVLNYLKNTNDEIYIVSSYQSRKRKDNDNDAAGLSFFQSEKIKLSGVADLVVDTLVVGVDKTAVLEKLNEKAKQEEKSICFLDDDVENIKAARQLSMKAIWYRIAKDSTVDSEEGVLSASSFAEFLEFKKQLEVKN